MGVTINIIEQQQNHRLRTDNSLQKGHAYANDTYSEKVVKHTEASLYKYSTVYMLSIDAIVGNDRQTVCMCCTVLKLGKC